MLPFGVVWACCFSQLCVWGWLGPHSALYLFGSLLFTPVQEWPQGSHLIAAIVDLPRNFRTVLTLQISLLFKVWSIAIAIPTNKSDNLPLISDIWLLFGFQLGKMGWREYISSHRHIERDYISSQNTDNHFRMVSLTSTVSYIYH